MSSITTSSNNKQITTSSNNEPKLSDAETIFISLGLYLVNNVIIIVSIFLSFFNLYLNRESGEKNMIIVSAIFFLILIGSGFAELFSYNKYKDIMIYKDHHKQEKVTIELYKTLKIYGIINLTVAGILLLTSIKFYFSVKEIKSLIIVESVI